jgi:hypothetical protein
MSTKETRKNRVRVAGWLVAVGIPFTIAVGAAEMTTLTVCLTGLWVFGLEVIAANHEWKDGRLRSIAQSVYVQFLVVIVTFAVMGWTACWVRKPALIDPEATENKYVRVKNVSSPDGKFSHAILIEFGVTKWNSEGIAVAMPFEGDKWDDWWGEPGRTDRQEEDNDVLLSTSSSPHVVNGVLRVKNSLLSVTPRRSYYLCIMSYAKILREPKEVLYFTIAQNEKMLSPKREALGHQYQHRE